jgi:hypothetical protein
MSTRKDPWKSIGRPSYTGIHKMPYDLEHRAFTHESNRQRAVAKVYVDLYCMVVKGFVDPTQQIGVSGAESQSLFGSAAGDTEAAHCVPRQLILGTLRLQDVLHQKMPERSLAVAALFGETDILPKNFNKADSRAEQCGLEEAFRFAAEALVFDAKSTETLQVDQMSISVKTAFSAYKSRAAAAFRSALQELDEKVRRIKNSKVQHVLRTKEEKKWTEQQAIMKLYLKYLPDSTGLMKALDPSILSGIIRVYNEE